jgi:peptidoglycan hydrolase-like protein with peptidoglycan-binding domain
MKKTVVRLLGGLILLLSSSAYLSALTCVDLPINLSKGAESPTVMSLQQFLFDKGYLQAKPNGYFGVGTEQAVKKYQKSLRYLQSGYVLPMTRAAIKKETCNTASSVSITTPAPSQVTKTDAPVITHPIVAYTDPAPTVTSVNNTIILIGGDTDWGVVIHGTNFSPTSNTIYIRDRTGAKKYTIGTLPSEDKLTITLPNSLGHGEFSCGGSCKQKIAQGEYFVIVETPKGGESNVGPYIVVRGTNIESHSATPYAPIAYNATSTRLATFNFNAATPLTIASVGFTANNASSTVLKNIILKDESTGAVLVNSGAGIPLYDGEYRMIGVYADVATTDASIAKGYFTLVVTDSVVKRNTSFTSPLVAVSFGAEPAQLTRARLAGPTLTLTSLDKVIILTSGITTWQTSVYGTGFSSSTNNVYLKLRQSNKKYSLGMLPSLDGTTILLPKSLGTISFPCGIGCEEPLPAGDYDLMVTNAKGESNTLQLLVKGFNISATTGSLSAPLPKTAKGVRLGSLSFGTNTPLKISAIKFNISVENNTSSIGGVVLRDEVAGAPLVSEGKDIAMYESDSKLIGAYGDVSTTNSTTATGYFSVDVIDYISNKITTLLSPKFVVTLSTY